MDQFCIIGDNTLKKLAKSLVDSRALAQEINAFTQCVESNSQRQAPVKGIRKSTHYSERFFDPSVVLSGDLQDMAGQVFARQGEVINPLATVPFVQTLYFINSENAEQIEWMQRQRPQTLMVKIILVNGDIPRTSKTLDSRVYFDQGGALSRRFGPDDADGAYHCFPELSAAAG